MNRLKLCLPLLCVVACTPMLLAQPPEDRSQNPDQPRRRPLERHSPIEHLLSHDQNDDGVIEPLELIAERLKRLFVRADKDQDGKLTKEELEAEFKSTDEVESPRRPPRGEGPRSDHRRAGPPRDQDPIADGASRDRDRGPEGPARRQPPGPGRFGPPPFGPGGPPKPGTVMPPFVQDSLDLTEAQRDQLAELQKQVDAQLAEILTSEQRERLEQRQPMFRHRRGPDEQGDRDGRRPKPRD